MRKITDEALKEEFIEKLMLRDALGEGILNISELHLFGKGEIILSAGDELGYYYIIANGKAKVTYLLENGTSILLKFHTEPNSLGDIEFLRNHTVKCDVEAVKDTYLIAFPALKLRESYIGDPMLLRHLADGLSDKLFATLNNSSYNLAYPLINRLSSYLCEVMTDDNMITLSSTFQDISKYLGTTYRHLYRTLKKLESDGIIKVHANIVHVLDEKKLMDLSKNSFLK